MQIQDITLAALPINMAEAANAIKRTQSASGQQILNTLSDKQVVLLWQFGLSEAQSLSLHNQSQGKQPVNYPHLWVKSNLFKLVFPRWLEQEREAQEVIKKIQNGTFTLPKSEAPPRAIAPVPDEYYQRLRNNSLPSPTKLPPLHSIKSLEG